MSGKYHYKTPIERCLDRIFALGLDPNDVTDEQMMETRGVGPARVHQIREIILRGDHPLWEPFSERDEHQIRQREWEESQQRVIEKYSLRAENV